MDARFSAWALHWEELQCQIAPCFARIELRRRARSYLEGLLAPLERKNGWHLAEAAGDASPDGVQDFLARTRWDADTLRDVLRSYVIEHLADLDGVLVIDETGFLKKGDKSAGVQRQYSGTAGRIENCQVGVFLGYAGARGYAFIDRALYLPADWVADGARCAQAHIPTSIGFATKPELARQMLERAFDAGVPCAWVVGDSVYGVSELRAFVAKHERGYVLGVTSGQQLYWPHHRTVAEIANDFPQRAWQRVSCGPGAKGPRVYQWLYQPYGSTEDGWCRGLLVRRHPKRRSERAYYLTRAPVGTSLQTLVEIAGRRWTIESGFEQAKGEVGLDQYEVRRFDGWLRHITLALLAHAFLAAIRARSAGGKISARALAHALAAHRAGSAQAAHRVRVHVLPGGQSDPGLVTLAATASAARQAMPLGTPPS
jgi:SRSO17 transposase